jgi:hypothetical protein
LSEASRPVREEATALFRQVVEGSTLRVPADLQAELPRLLWLYHMGLVLFWIHDTSPGRARSRRLVDGTVALIDRLVVISKLPLLRRIRRQGMQLVRELGG